MHRLVAHAIVSDDDRIADADWERFQGALDAAALTLLGRASHVAAPNVRNRRRLVLSRRAKGLERRPDAWWLNPDEVPLAAALAELVPGGGLVAVPGGQAVFDLVGAAGFAEFHLARAHGVRLPGGRGLFAACEAGVPAADILAAGGLRPGAEDMIDPAAAVGVTVWRG
jgi:hypothetical protein